MKTLIFSLIFLPFSVSFATAQNLHFGPRDKGHETQKLDRIVLIINDITLSEREFRHLADTLYARLPPELQKRADPEVDKIILNQIINQTLLEGLRQRSNIELNDEMLNDALNNIAAQNKISVEEVYRRAHAEMGLDREAFRAEMRKQIITDEIKYVTVGREIKVSDQQVEDQIARLMRSEETELHAEDLLVPLPDVPPEERAAPVQAILQQVSEHLKKQLSLAEMAQQISGAQFHDLGYINLRTIPQRFAQALANTGVGEMIDFPVADSDGLHFLRVVDKKSLHISQPIAQANVSMILLRSGQGQNEEDVKKQIDELYQRLQNGESFADLARNYSQDVSSAIRGGEVGWRSVEDVHPEFAQIMLSLPLNTFSHPFKTALGWQIIRVSERKEDQQTDARLKTAVRNSLAQKYLEEQWQQWIARNREEAYIEFKL